MTPTSNGGSPKVMVSNLPLLFARGSPTSLESMCLEELQLFLKFVLRCEQNSSSLNLLTLKRPAWWPSGVGVFSLVCIGLEIKLSRLTGGKIY